MQDPITNEIRYIGLSTQGYRRISDHFYKFKLDKDNTYKGRWLKVLRQNNLLPKIRIIQEFKDISRQNLAECEKYWIKFHKDKGCPLTNLTDGGDGTSGSKWGPNHKRRTSPHPRQGKPWTEEQRQLISERTKLAMARPEIKSKCVGNKTSNRFTGSTPIIDSIGNIYKSIEDAAYKLKVTSGAIKHVLAGRNKHCKNYTFKYLGVGK